MKSLLIVTSLLFFVIGCRENSTNPSSEINPISSSAGNVELRFEKATIPAGVVTISAMLSREGFLTLTKTLSLLSDTTAETTFERVPIGTWKLKIDAFGSDPNVALYSGQTDVTVFESAVTQVNLILQPVGTGMGSIKIVVSWNNVKSSWSDNLNNPILQRQNTKYDGRGIGYPVIYKDETEYKMWYLNVQSAPDSLGAWTSIGLATSKDANTWAHYSTTPVIKPTPKGWDAVVIETGPVLKEGDTYKMYYNGYGTDEVRQVGLATSKDGIQWEKRSEPVLRSTNGWDHSICTWGVVKVNGLYYMYYNSDPPQYIGLATSQDGINWTRYAGNPIIVPSQSWESSGISLPSVYFENGSFHMEYLNWDSSAKFGYATSSDGVHWTKDPLNPIFSKTNTSNNWSPVWISYASLTKIGAQERIYYTGANANSVMSIGFAYKN
jgi:predicted GH43/DUF377 family glycosyl hydrolase